MATRQHPRAPRNDAVTVIDRLFGDVEGWSESVNESANANEVAQQLYALRERHALTQKELASLVGTTQSAIARLEDANYEGHSLSLLTRIATAVGERVRVTFEAPVERAKGRALSSFLQHMSASYQKMIVFNAKQNTASM